MSPQSAFFAGFAGAAALWQGMDWADDIAQADGWTRAGQENAGAAVPAKKTAAAMILRMELMSLLLYPPSPKYQARTAAPC